MLECGWQQRSFQGGPMPKKRMKRHAVIQPLDPSYKIIALTHGQNTLVDVADYEWLNQWNWHAQWNKFSRCFYARRWNHGKAIQMAREILGCGPGEEADHRDRNSLDNRQKNLRKATRFQNGSNRRNPSNNTSGFRGVSLYKRTGKWESRIRYKGKLIHLGLFSTAEEAARAYDEAAKIYHGEFAALNFPKNKNPSGNS
jgi:hypothetical protein